MSSREKFEQSIKSRFGDLIDYRVCKNSDGEYMDWDMQVAWWAWRASEASTAAQLTNAESKCAELLDELEAAEERYEDMLRQARSFREAHDSASELIRKLERNKLVVKLPTTKLWADKVACYEESEIIAALASAGIGVKGE